MTGQAGTETGERRVTLGVLLNMGAGLGTAPEAVFDLTLEQATAAEQLGYDSKRAMPKSSTMTSLQDFALLVTPQIGAAPIEPSVPVR